MNERLTPNPVSERLSPREVTERYNRHELANLETYKYFNQRGERAEASRRAFVDAAMAGNTPDAPEFTYPAIDVDTLLQWRDELTELLSDVVELDMGNEDNLALREKVVNRLHEIGIMLLTKMQEEIGPSHDNYEAVSYALGENMREVYGSPDPKHWRGILGYRLAKLSKVEQMDEVPDEIFKAWTYLKASLPQDLPIERPYSARPETLEWYAKQLEARMLPAREAIEAAVESGEIIFGEDGKLDADNIVKATRMALDAYGAHGWAVELTDEANIDTSQKDKTIYIPKKRRMTKVQFDTVMVGHEIDRHVASRENGDATGDAVLQGTGLNGYLSWDEGNGKVNEALITGKLNTETSANAHYMTGGLILGLDRPDERGRIYGETFDIVWRMELVEQYVNGKLGADTDLNAIKRTIMEKMVTRLDRSFRGTDGRAPGVALTKDSMTYYPGSIQVLRKWDADMSLPEEDRLREHALERAAKIHPLRTDHRRIVQQAMAT